LCAVSVPDQQEYLMNDVKVGAGLFQHAPNLKRPTAEHPF
jgi:hypothetical protein